MESYISLGGTKILLALFAQRYIFGQKYKNQRKYTPLYEKDIKLKQNKPMETTNKVPKMLIPLIIRFFPLPLPVFRPRYCTLPF